MKKIDLGQTITILANLGVIGGIVFLAFEIRQNTAQMRAEAAYSIHQDVQSLNRDIYQDPEFANLVIQGEQSFDTLEPIDQRRVRAYFYSELNLADFIMGLEEDGLSNVSFRYVDLIVDQFQSIPGRQEFLRSVMAPENVDEHYFRSDELYQRIAPK
jgi:hypothetical protein